MLGNLNVNITKIVVTDLKDNTYYAEITLKQNGKQLVIDARPSDAISDSVANRHTDIYRPAGTG